MWELDYKESWVSKNWCFWTVVLEKTLESPLDCKEIKPVNPKENQSWIFIGRTDVEAPVLWLLMRTDSLEKTLMLEKMEAGGEGDYRGWDGWMAPLTQWTWVWASSGSYWWTRKPGVLQSTVPQSWTWFGKWTTCEDICPLSNSHVELCDANIENLQVVWVTGKTIPIPSPAPWLPSLTSWKLTLV